MNSETIFTALFAFPLGIPSVLLVIVLIYWLTVIIGMTDLDVLELDAESSSGGGGMMVAMGLDGIPLTLIISIQVFWTWLLTAISIQYLMPSLGGASALLLGSGLLVLSFISAGFLSTMLLKPLRPLFRDRPAPSKSSLIGQICEIKTSRVDADFGQAEYSDEGAGGIIHVRYDGDYKFKRHEKAIIIDFDETADSFGIMPLDEESKQILFNN